MDIRRKTCHLLDIRRHSRPNTSNSRRNSARIIHINIMDMDMEALWECQRFRGNNHSSSSPSIPFHITLRRSIPLPQHRSHQRVSQHYQYASHHPELQLNTPDDLYHRPRSIRTTRIYRQAVLFAQATVLRGFSITKTSQSSCATISTGKYIKHQAKRRASIQYMKKYTMRDMDWRIYRASKTGTGRE